MYRDAVRGDPAMAAPHCEFAPPGDGRPSARTQAPVRSSLFQLGLRRKIELSHFHWNRVRIVLANLDDLIHRDVFYDFRLARHRPGDFYRANRCGLPQSDLLLEG